MKHCASSARAGFTLTELMVGAAVGSIVLAGLVLASVSLQRTFVAVNGFGQAQTGQIYVLDYITRDVRRGKSVAVTASPPTLTVSAQSYLGSTGMPRMPSISSGAITYGGGTDTMVYKLSGTNLVREQAGNQLVIASGVTSFSATLDPADSKQKTVSVTLTFASPMQWRSASGTGTTITMQAKATARN